MLIPVSILLAIVCAVFAPIVGGYSGAVMSGYAAGQLLIVAIQLMLDREE